MIIIANLCPNIFNLDALDFSECRSEVWRSDVFWTLSESVHPDTMHSKAYLYSCTLHQVQSLWNYPNMCIIV